MRLRVSLIFAIAVLCLAPTAGLCQEPCQAPPPPPLAPFSTDFEDLVQPLPGALADAGWLVFGNVFAQNGEDYVYGYGPFCAPNGTPGFSSVALGEGGPDQGNQQLVVYSDYNNPDHGIGRYIEANVFREFIVGAGDIGGTWRFDFDAKRGDIGGGSIALAFFKTIDPNAGYALTNFITADMTNIPDTWGSYSLSIFIDPSLEGQILQFGFLAKATEYEPSGIFYDNVSFGLAPVSAGLDIKPGSCPNPINRRSRGVLPVAIVGTGDLDVGMIDPDSLQLEGAAPVDWGYEDVADPYSGDTCSCAESSPDGIMDLMLHFDTQAIISVIGELPNGEVALTLTGALLDGTPLEGADCVVLVGRNRLRLAQQLEGQAGGGDVLDLQLDESDNPEPATPQGSTRDLRNPSRRTRGR